MAVVSTPPPTTTTTTDGIRTSFDSFPSSPLISKSASDDGSEASFVGISGAADTSERDDQFDLSSANNKEIEIQSPGYLKSEEYRLLFRLPSDEVLVQDFNCAFQESILFQGHLYMFVRHICFYSNIFGFETKKSIPFHEITCIRKAKTAGIFPNAIEILAGERKYFFASFLFRDEAYRLIVDGWSQHSDGISDCIDRQDSKSEIRSPDSGLVITPYRNKDDSLSGEPELPAIAETGNGDVSVSSELLESEETSKGAEPAVIAECSSAIQPFRWIVEDADPPQVPECYTKVAESKFLIPVEEFFSLFFSDEAVKFVESFHKRCGDKDFTCSSWYKHEQIGHARDLSFEHPIKLYFGARFSHCQEIQKLRVYRNRHLIIETSQEVGDVPYADYFRVQGFWDVEEDTNQANRCCILRVYVNVAFSKKTMWKGKIETNTIEECRDAYAIWIEDAHEILKQKKLEKIEDTKCSVIQNVDNVEVDDTTRIEEEGPDRLDNKDLGVSQVEASNPRICSPPSENRVARNKNPATSTTSVLKEVLTRFCSYLKSQQRIPMVLVVGAILILLLMQVSIIVLLRRPQQVHVVSSQVDYMMSGTGSSSEAEAVAWLEKRICHLKEEMLMVESRMEKMRHEYVLLNSHLKTILQLQDLRQ